MAEGNGRAWSSEVKDLGDKIATLTVTKAVELSEYMEEVNKIKPAAAGVAVMPGGGGGAAEVAEKPAEKRSSPCSLTVSTPPRRSMSSRSCARSRDWD